MEVTDEQILKAYAENNNVAAHAAKALGIPASTFRNRFVAAKARAGGKTDDADNEPSLVQRASDILYRDKKNPEDLTFKEMLSAFKEAQGFRSKFSIKQYTAKVEIKTKTPIALAFLSDIHLGSYHTDYEALEQDVDDILNDDKVYVCLGGDISDKMSTFRIQTAADTTLHPTKYQLLTEEKLMELLAERLVGKCGGNHDTMDSRKSGVDSNYFILRGKKFPYLPLGGVIELKVGEVTYDLLWNHRGRFNSSLNLFNAHRQGAALRYPTADIVVMEHEHNPGIESLERFDYGAARTVVNIRTGTYKIDDSFSMEFFKAGKTAPQTVILWPDRKKILAMHGRDGIKDAITYLDGYGG